ncbi:iojap-like protein [Bacteriovorax sp. BSW11_IV]|uniref:ribosome silencing factor n=1 Tax=Bacteriovorax sp. BSW11_IV TaxID=1353529 RepID=UPI00038A3DB3|nr:ribosome silencing factor [Bacteriovorax sp. BSW11_IV]EQC45857.1 iojap-like protein [Bacteriovorax sp. BSW11_IV]
MSREFITKEVDKIFEDKNLSFPKNMALSAAWVLGNFKGINLKILDVSKTSSLADYYVLGSATNLTQAKSMAEEIGFQMRRRGHEVLSKEGMSDADWILIDFGDIIVHVFLESSRDVYDLDNLWTGAPTVEIPQSYYFSSDENPSSSSNDRGYF